MLSAFGRFYERGGGGGGGGCAVRFRPILRAGGEGGVLSAFGRLNEREGGGGVLSACVRKTRFLDERGGCKLQNPLKLRAKKKRNLDPPPPPCIRPWYCIISVTETGFAPEGYGRSGGSRGGGGGGGGGGPGCLNMINV